MEDTPKIRFRGFTDAWEQRKAVDIAEYSKGNGYSKSDLTEVGTPIILYGRLYTKYQFVINEVDTFATPKDGAIYSQGNEVIIPASGETAEDIARASAIEKSGILLGGDLNILRPFDFINPLFLALAISNGEAQKELAKRAQGKSIVHIHNSDIQEISVSYPTRTEQDQIVTVFRYLDHLITLHQRKCNDTKELKKYMLQKMFPQNGRKIPEIRFAEFTGDWEQRKLGDVFEEYSEKDHTELPALTIIQGSGTVKREESDRNLIYNKSNLSGYKMVRENDFIVHLRSFEGGLEKASSDGIISPAYHTFHGKNVDSRFYYPYFRSQEFIKKKLIAHVYGIRDGRSIDIDGMKTIEIPYTSYEEQCRIGDYLETLDHLITLHQRKCDELKKVKKFMLHNMFPQKG